MRSLDHVGALFGNHVHRVLDSAVRDDRDDGGINDTEVLDTVHPELRVDDTLVDVLGEASGTGRVECGLAALQHSAFHLFVRIERHIPRVFIDHNVLKAVPFEEKIIRPPNPLAHSDYVEVVGEEVEVDVRLLQRIGTVERNLTGLGHGANQINNHTCVTSLLGDGEMPLEGAAEHANKVKLEVGSSVRLKGVHVAVADLGLAVDGVSHQVFINAWEANQLQASGANRSGLVLVIFGRGLFVEGALVNEDVVHAEAILDTQDEGDGRMVNQVLADMARLENQLNTVLGQLVGRTNPAEHQQLGAFKDTLREDDFAGGVEAEFGARRGDDDHTGASARGLVDD